MYQTKTVDRQVNRLNVIKSRALLIYEQYYKDAYIQQAMLKIVEDANGVLSCKDILDYYK